MEVIKISNLTTKFNEKKKPLIAIWGFFDGWHLGHQALLNQMQDLAKQYNYQTLVISFDVKPQSILLNQDMAILMNNQKKQDFLAKKQINYYCQLEFTKELASVSFDKYINFLLANNVVAVVCAKNIHFGSKGKGNLTSLQNSPLKIFVSKDIFDQNNKKISSSYIKELLLNKDISHANKLLCTSYSIIGKVVDGIKEGRTLGFPTANLSLTDNYLIPGSAIYISLTKVDNRWYQSITLVIERNNKPLIETYLLDFNKNIYGKIIEVKFLAYLRDNQKFDSKEDLIEQINRDLVDTIAYFKNVT